MGGSHRIIDCIRNSYRLATIQGYHSVEPLVLASSAIHPTLGYGVGEEQAEIESRREGVPDEVMEGLDFERRMLTDEGEVGT